MTITPLLADLSTLLGGGWIPIVIVLLGVGAFKGNIATQVGATICAYRFVND